MTAVLTPPQTKKSAQVKGPKLLPPVVQAAVYLVACLALLELACRLTILRTPSGSINDTETKLLQDRAKQMGICVLDLDQKWRAAFSPADNEKTFTPTVISPDQCITG